MPRLIGLVAACALMLAGLPAMVSAQDDDEAPGVETSLPALILDTEGVTIGVALLAELEEDADDATEDEENGVQVGVYAVGLAAGEHGIHVHETGVCDPDGERAFASAGGHYNPTDAEHGDHAGDLGNITADEDSTAVYRETTDSFTLDELLDEDGTSIVIHAEEDENDPEGESFGARIACGVIAAPVDDAPAAAETAEAEAAEGTATEDATDDDAADDDTDDATVEVTEAATEPVATEEATEEAA